MRLHTFLGFIFNYVDFRLNDRDVPQNLGSNERHTKLVILVLCGCSTQS